MPESFLKTMKQLLGEEEYKKLLQSYEEMPKKSIRLQTDKIDSKTWEANAPFAIKKIEPLEASYYIKEDKIGNHPYHHAGLFYSQEPSAMLPPTLVSYNDHFRILDLCASPGGKTLTLANQVPDGFVLANEINYNRAKKLLSNIERLGLKNVVVSSMSSEALKKIYQEYFDVILIDAPCSGEGMFRKDEKASKEWSIEKIEEMVTIGGKLLEDAAFMLKKGGRLIYSTCTFNLQENEQQIVKFLKKHFFEIVEIDPKYDTITKPGIKIEEPFQTQRAKRCYPYLFGEGQFMIVLEKKEEHEEKKIENHLQPLDKKETVLIDEFIKTNLTNQNYIIQKYQNNIVVVPKKKEIPKMTLLSCFVKMGEIKNNRFIPHHQFAKAYGTDFKNQCYLELDDPRLLSYLKGEEIEAEVLDGYGVVFVNSYPLGLFKAKNNHLKNHYPKGLRYQK